MRIFVTKKVPVWEEVSKPLVDAGHEIKFGVLADIDETYEGLLCLLTDKINEEVLAKVKDLKIIANYAVGFDNVDVAACQKRNIAVTNTPSEKVNESVAEHAWALMLALTRRITEANEFMRNAAYRGWEPDIFLGSDMAGKTLGVVGLGRIGSMVAKRAEGWGMKVMSVGREGSLEELLRESDYVSLHVPLTAETRHLINGKNLPMMKKSAFLETLITTPPI